VYLILPGALSRFAPFPLNLNRRRPVYSPVPSLRSVSRPGLPLYPSSLTALLIRLLSFGRLVLCPCPLSRSTVFPCPLGLASAVMSRCFSHRLSFFPPLRFAPCIPPPGGLFALCLSRWPVWPSRQTVCFPFAPLRCNISFSLALTLRCLAQFIFAAPLVYSCPSSTLLLAPLSAPRGLYSPVSLTRSIFLTRSPTRGRYISSSLFLFPLHSSSSFVIIPRLSSSSSLNRSSSLRSSPTLIMAQFVFAPRGLYIPLTLRLLVFHFLYLPGAHY